MDGEHVKDSAEGEGRSGPPVKMAESEVTEGGNRSAR
jgi:hypothetical protein